MRSRVEYIIYNNFFIQLLRASNDETFHFLSTLFRGLEFEVN